jgi:hypothetical protein
MFKLDTKYPYSFKIVTENDENYLDIFDEETLEKQYLLKFSNQDELNKLVGRYTTPTKLAGLGQGVNIFAINMMQMRSHQSYMSPKLEDGWFKIVKIFCSMSSIDDIANFENSLIFHPAIHAPFLKQSTAFYANSSENLSTVIETKYSASIVEFHFVNYDGHIVVFVEFYYKGNNKTDIPVDLQMCINQYGKYDCRS